MGREKIPAVPEPVVLTPLEFRALDPELSRVIEEIARRAFDGSKVLCNSCYKKLDTPSCKFCPYRGSLLCRPGK